MVAHRTGRFPRRVRPCHVALDEGFREVRQMPSDPSKKSPGCPIGEPSRVVEVPAMSPAQKTAWRPHAEIPLPSAEPATAVAAALPGADAGDVRRIQRV